MTQEQILRADIRLAVERVSKTEIGDRITPEVKALALERLFNVRAELTEFPVTHEHFNFLWLAVTPFRDCQTLFV